MAYPGSPNSRAHDRDPKQPDADEYDRPWWAGLPTDRAAYVRGLHLDDLEGLMDELPPEAPAVIVFRDVKTGSGLPQSSILRALDLAVRQLYPAWLPGAESVEGRGEAARSAVAALCKVQAGRSSDFAHFLSDVADRALTDTAYRGSLADDVRVEELFRLFVRSYGRTAGVLLTQYRRASPAAEQRTITGVAQWISTHAHVGVWLVGDGEATDPLPAFDLSSLIPSAGEPPRPGRDIADVEPVTFPSLAGRPHPKSWIETRLEKAMLELNWATGRRWNQNLQLSALSNPIRVDLIWEQERCIVEIDGDEHRLRRHYLKDRRRDNGLQLKGYAVLRFTNDEIYHDLATTLRRIEQFLQSRRST